MPTLDDVSKQLWNHTKPPLGLLATIGCARAASIPLSPEDRAPFDALSDALLARPTTRRTPTDIYEKELAACLRAHDAPEPQRLDLAMDAAYMQMAALLKLEPRSFPSDDVYKLDEDDFVKLTRALAKQGRTDLELWKSRYEYLLASEEKAWPALSARAERMGWSRPMSRVRELSKAQQDLARMSDLGATAAWSMMGGKHALTLQLGSTKRTAIMDDADRQTLIAALPWLA